jgi:hypothetical protein
MKSIEINGQTYPFRVGLRAIENFEIRTKSTLADFKGSVNHVLVLGHEGIKAGQRHLKEKELDFEELRDAIDFDPKAYKNLSVLIMEELMPLTSEMMGIEEALPEEEKKSEESQ